MQCLQTCLRQLNGGFVGVGHRQGQPPWLAAHPRATAIDCERLPMSSTRRSGRRRNLHSRATSSLASSCAAPKSAGSIDYAPRPPFPTPSTSDSGIWKNPAPAMPRGKLARPADPVTAWASKDCTGLMKKAGLAHLAQRRWASFFSSAMRRLALSCFCSSCMRSRNVTLPSSLIFFS